MSLRFSPHDPSGHGSFLWVCVATSLPCFVPCAARSLRYPTILSSWDEFVLLRGDFLSKLLSGGELYHFMD